MLKISNFSENELKSLRNENKAYPKETDIKNISKHNDDHARIVSAVRANLEAFIC
jgi:hypothetical protein